MDTSIRFIKGVGPRKERLLNRIGIFSLKDILYYFPCRYQDRTQVKPISSLKEGPGALIKAEVATLNLRKSFYGRKSLLQAALRDSSGIIYSVWFNQPYLTNYLYKGETYYFYGRAQLYKNKLQLISPEFDKIDNDEKGKMFSGIVPFYRLTQNLTQSFLRRLIHFCLHHFSQEIVEPLPFQIRKSFNFLNVMEALYNMHFPASFEKLKKSRERFIFEEFFIMQILIFRRKAEFRLKKRQSLAIDYSVVNKVKDNFGFLLTGDQEKVLADLLSDLASSLRNCRLLQGDVGSGKTIVASIDSFCVAKMGYQVAFMVPTEVLAIQHKKTLESLAKGLNIKIDILTSGLSKSKKASLYKKLANGSIDIIVGTHALLNEQLKFKHLRLIIIDEQHRFGVAQRAILAHKGLSANVLVMSATPIPRSLALTLYGDLEVSLIKEYPKNRRFPTTKIVQEAQRSKVYDFVREKIKEGRQIYIIYALVEESRQSDLYPAVQMYEELRKEFKSYKLGLLHGRLDSAKKQDVLSKFSNKEIDVLVSTLVVEVGLDVPNATVMVIENPERFGLAQLHQLRGRIMRSHLPSDFFMIAKSSMSALARRRLKIIEATNDGFVIAEQDLKLRGPGDLFGTLQAGYLPVSIASIGDDLAMLKKARLSAFELIKQDPFLELNQHKDLNARVKDLIDKCIFWQAS